MDVIYFIVKYIPFWAVPLIIIFIPTGYIFWTKDNKLIALIFFLLAALCFLLISYWIWAGGPDRSVQALEILLNS